MSSQSTDAKTPSLAFSAFLAADESALVDPSVAYAPEKVVGVKSAKGRMLRPLDGASTIHSAEFLYAPSRLWVVVKLLPVVVSLIDKVKPLD